MVVLNVFLSFGLVTLFYPTGVRTMQSGFNGPLDFPTVKNGFRAQDFNVDRNISTDDDIAYRTQKALPNMPVIFCHDKRRESMFYKNRSCAPFPKLRQLEVNNLYYQIFRTTRSVTYLFGAYYDVRLRNPAGPSVRILGMVGRAMTQQSPMETYCQVWFSETNEPIIVKASYYTMWSIANQVIGYYYPTLITCPIPSSSTAGRVPIFVSLVRNQCDTASNTLRVTYNKPNQGDKKGRFAVCVRIMDLLDWDQSARIVEWIEMMKLLGAEKVYFYPLTVHENITKVFRYYAKQGTVEETPITLAGDQPNMPGLAHLYIHDNEKENSFQNWMNELISLNDCFYKNLYKYEYITLLDFDEVIMPMKEFQWKPMLKNISATLKSPMDAFLIRPTHFRLNANDNASGRKENLYWVSQPQEGIPPYMYMLQRVLRDDEHWNSNFKTFFSTDSVEVVHNHIPLKCFRGECKMLTVDPKDAQLQHYHVRGPSKSLVTDTTIWKYKKSLIDRCLAVYYQLGFFK